MINIRNSPYYAKGDGKTDDTAAIQKAIAAAIKKPGGDELYFPVGRYCVTGLNLSQATGLWDKHIKLRGDHWQASRVILNTEGIGIDCIGASNLEFDGIGFHPGNAHPSVGVLWARSETSRSANNCRMRNCQINGWFTQAAFATFGAELQQVENCRIENSRPYSVALAAGTDGKIWIPDGSGSFKCVQVVSPNGKIPFYGAECNNYRGCLVTCAGDGGLPLSIADSFNCNFDGTFFSADGKASTTCALVIGETQAVFHGPLNFNGCTFESGDAHGVVLYRGHGIRAFYGIHLNRCSFVLFGENQESLTYLGPGERECCWADGSYIQGFRYNQDADSIRLHYVERCDIFAPGTKVRIDSANVNNRIVSKA